MRVVALLALSIAGCDGVIGDPSRLDGPGVGAAGTCTDPSTIGPAPLRRLTHDEYDRTIRDLLGDESAPARSFPTDTASTGFDNQASQLGVTALLAEGYMLAAERLAASAVARGLPTLLCDPA